MNALRFHVCMAVSRPQNIPALARGLIDDMEPHPFELRWHLAVQGPEPDPMGSRKFNELIDMVPDGWLYLMSDDTVHFPQFLRRIGETIEAHPEAGVIVVNQERPAINPGIGSEPLPNGKVMLRAHPLRMIPGQVCGGQCIYRRDLLGNHRYDYEQHLYASDGYLAQQMYREHPDRFVFLDELLVRFNSLE